MGAEQLNDLLAFWNTCGILSRREKWTVCNWCMFTEKKLTT